MRDWAIGHHNGIASLVGRTCGGVAGVNACLDYWPPQWDCFAGRNSQGRTCGSVDAGRECVIGLLGATTGLLAGRTNLWWRSRRECVVGLLGANMGLLRW
jgi:hypothetical protein